MAYANQNYQNDKIQPPSYYPNTQQQQQPLPLPGYTNISATSSAQQPGGYFVQQPPNQVTYVTQTTTASSTSVQHMVPIMPLGVAIVFCVVNCLMPGFGTMLAAFTVFCCARIEQNPSGESYGAFGMFCLNFWIGWSQLLTVWVFFAGWIWSIMWGIYFIKNAGKYGQNITTTTATTSTAPLPPSQFAVPTSTNVIVAPGTPVR